MNKQELCNLIEAIVRKQLNESEYINDLYNKKFFKLTENFLNSFMSELKKSDNYKDNK